MPEEKRLITELTVCNQERLAAQSALSDAPKLVFLEEYQRLLRAAELARNKVDTVRVRLRSLRTAKRRKKDSHDLHNLQNALNGLAEEIDTITYDSEAGKEKISDPEAMAAHHERYVRLEAIREKLAELTLVMDSVDCKPRSRRRDSKIEIGEAVQKLQSAESNLDDVVAHLSHAVGAQVSDRNEIASAKSSASNVEDDLKAAKAALKQLQT